MTAVLLDEMVPAAIAMYLREHGRDAVAVLEVADLVGCPDSEILEWAARQMRVLVTLNIVDFARLDRQWLAQDRRHQGILYVSSKTFPAKRGAVWNIAAALEARMREGTLPTSGSSWYL